jgi:hypothetical protein
MQGVSNPGCGLQYLLWLIRSDITGAPPILDRGEVGSELMSLARLHGLIPLLQRTIGRSPEIPDDIRGYIRQVAVDNAREALRLAGDLVAAMNVLSAAGIPAVAFKGPALAIMLYGDPAQRQFSDIDVLIHRRDIPHAVAVLQARGFRSLLDYSPGQASTYMHAACEWLVRSPSGELLELHWQFVPRYFALSVDFDELFQRATTITLAGTPIRTLAPEDQLLALAVHASKHEWERLCLAAEIAQSLHTGPPIQWNTLLQRARGCGALRIVLVSLQMSEWLVPMSLPANVRAALDSDPVASRIAKDAQNRILARQISGEQVSAKYFRYLMSLRERRSDRARIIFRLALSPGVGELTLARLPRRLTPLYRVFRVARLAGRAWRTVIGGGSRALGLQSHSGRGRP